MSHVKRLDHIGITVADLDSATAFFVGVGLELGDLQAAVDAVAADGYGLVGGIEQLS